MCNYLKKILHPASFQGRLSKKHYFEGWYFKLVNQERNNIYSIIPGISLDKKEGKHAFIQIINGNTAETHYITYPIESFQFSPGEFNFRIDDNIFGENGINLSVHEKDIRMEGSIQFGELNPWPVSFFSPGAMGWYAYMPLMECYHGILSFDHVLRGYLTINGSKYSFDNGRGYVEKDWGRSFPSYYIWIQANHFKEEGISIMASLANIPWLGRYFDGFLIGFLYGKKLYRFTTYTGAKIKHLEIFPNRVILHVRDKRKRIEVDVTRTQAPGELKSPILGAMTNRIRESLTSLVKVRLIELNGKSEMIIYEGESNHAGFEIGGEIEKLKQKK